MKVLKIACSFGLALSALASTAHAQTVEFTGIGSSALFLELGQAAYSLSETQHPTQTTCSWTTGDKTTPAISATDNGPSPSISNTGNFWVIYTAGNGTCAAPVVTASKPVYVYSNLQVDSAVGNRCVFRTGAANQQCALVVPSTGVTQVGGANLLTGITDTTSPLPSKIISALNGQTFQVAASDIRPEDSLFSIVRATTPLNTPVATGSQYLGEGYNADSKHCASIGIQGVATHGGGTVTAAGFALPGGTDPCTGAAAVKSFNAIEVGATPVVVFVNPSNPSGFGNSAIVNVNRGVLSTFVNGLSCRTFDFINQAHAGGGQYTTTFLREPFSGTYNTFEYSIPNTVELQTSQEANIASPTTQPLNLASCKGLHGSRQRVTSGGNMIAAVLSTTDSLGYSFWSTANFKNATTSTGKYLTVDGVDPLMENYDEGCIPTVSGSGTCALSAVTFPHIVDGSYPIWSVQRLVTTSNTSATQTTTASQLAAAAQAQVSSSQPDFVPATTLYVVHSHFVPPGLGTLSGTITAQNNDGTCNHAEAGGDVGGIVYNQQTESDYCNEFATYVGFTGRRQ
jgi:hypothetical protein